MLQFCAEVNGTRDKRRSIGKLSVASVFVVEHVVYILREWLLTQRSALPCIRVIPQVHNYFLKIL